jgi:shikimate kinase
MECKKRSLVLIGYKGVGKSTYGRMLADKMGKKFIETDLLVEDLYDRKYSCREIVLKWGEKAFRKVERDVIFSLINVENAVISTGGGAILSRENRVNLKQIGVCIYLLGKKSLIRERMLKSGVPSFLDPNNLEQSFEKMYRERENLYLDVCDFIIEV